VFVTPKQEKALRMLLANGPMYGLQMVKSSGGEIGRGTVYVVLTKLEDKGWIESKLRSPPAGKRGPERREYSITGSGRDVVLAIDQMRVACSINLAGG